MDDGHEVQPAEPRACRADRREGDTGLQRPKRPLPSDFRERYLDLGQSKELEEHYRTNWRVIYRWLQEAGGDELREARYQVSGSVGRPRQRSESRRSRYVLGLTLGGGYYRKRDC